MNTLPPSSLVMGVNGMIRFVWQGVQTKETGIYLPPPNFLGWERGEGANPPPSPSHATVRMLAQGVIWAWRPFLRPEHPLSSQL